MSLDPADADGDRTDVYVRDVAANQTLLATAFFAADQDAISYDLSGDGAWIAFVSEERLAASDTNTDDDVYRVAVAGGAPLLVSARDGASGSGNAYAGGPSISGDGTWVAFHSGATDLITPLVDANGGGTDVFARDVEAGRTHLVSNAAGLVRQTGDQSSSSPEIAGTPPSGGSTNVSVAYNSYADDLAPGGSDVSTAQSVYRRNLGTRFTASGLVSRATGAAGADADSSAYLEGISDDGRLVVFFTDAHNLGATGGGDGAYVRDVVTGSTVLGSPDNGSSARGAISGDGSLFVWNGQHGTTADSDPDASGVFARAYAAPPSSLGAPEFVSRPPGSAPFLLPALRTDLADAGEQAISADGRYVLFSGSTSRDLVGLGAIGHQLYRRDTLTGALELVSRATGAAGAPSTDFVIDRSISADGTRVVFSTRAALDPSDADSDADVYERDLAAATTTLVSRADGFAGADADDDAQGGRISADGTHVTFATTATNLGTPGVDRHVYLRDLTHGTTTVDRANGADGALANEESEDATLSADGRYVAFVTRANNLDPADPGPSISADVYVRDTVAATTLLVSRRDGADGQKDAIGAEDPVISADGRVVAFAAYDDALAPEGGAWAQTPQVVVRDLASATNRLVSRAPGGLAADAAASSPSVSGDGAVVAFASEATNLLPAVGGSRRSAVFVRTSASGALSGPPAFGLTDNADGNGAAGPSLSGDGHCLAFGANGHNAISGVAGDLSTAYVYVVSGSCPQRDQPSGPGGPGGPGGLGGLGGDQPRAQPSGPGRLPPLAKPILSKVSLLRASFRVGRAATAVSAKAKRKPAKGRPTAAGTAVRFTLNARAAVTIAIERSAPGRKLGKACRRPTPRLRRKRACTRWTAAGTLTRKGVESGRRSIAFSGRIGRRALAPGHYRATVSARNASGSAKAVTRAFTVTRR